MQQNNNSQGQVQRQLTQEELQKTQVLNLKEVEEAARFERITSKKPALIVALIGLFAIFFGTTFGVVQTMTRESVEPTITKKEVEQRVTDIKTLNCQLPELNRSDGVDVLYNFDFTFTDDQLTNVVKVSYITPTPNSPIGPTTITNFTAAMQSYLLNLPGYQVTIAPYNNTGVVVTDNIDYSQLDFTTLPDQQQNLFFTRVDFAGNSLYTDIYNTMIGLNYTCK